MATLADLEERFTAPPGWQTGAFRNDDTGHTIHYGFAVPANPVAVVVCLNGLSEFSEKYFETARDMLARGYAFYTMDWAYQGRSSRLPAPFTHRRHSDGYETDLADLHKFVTEHVLPGNTLPVILMAHSMGANLALRYLADHPGIFKAAALTAPLFGIKGFSAATNLLLNALFPFFPQGYIPMGADWKESWRKSDGSDKFSADPLRDALHNLWCLGETAVQVGSPTLSWVKKSLDSMAILNTLGTLEKITVPVLIALAGKEEIVCNNAIRAAASRLPACTVLEIGGARHEILMEKDEYRGRFLQAFDKLVKDNKIVA